MSSLRTFFSRLFSWPFVMGIGVGIALTVGGAFLISFLSFVVMQQSGMDLSFMSTSHLAVPDFPNRMAQTAHGTTPDAWTLHPARGETDSTSFGAVKGQVTVLNLWATWCGPCVHEMPTLQALHDSTGADVSVVLVSQEEKDTVRPFLEEEGYTMSAFVASDLPTVLEGTAIPRTYIINAEGRVVYRHVGAADWNANEVHDVLNRLAQTEPEPLS